MFSALFLIAQVINVGKQTPADTLNWDRSVVQKNKILDDELSKNGVKPQPNDELDLLDLRAAEKNRQLDVDIAKFREVSSQAFDCGSSCVKKPANSRQLADERTPVRLVTSGTEKAGLTNCVNPQKLDYAKNQSVLDVEQLAALRLSEARATEDVQFENEAERAATLFSIKRPVENEVVSPVQCDLVMEETINKRKEFPDFMSGIFNDDGFDDGNTEADDVACFPQVVNKQQPAPTQPAAAAGALSWQAAKCSASDAGGRRPDDAGMSLAKEDERRVAELERIKASLSSSLEK